MSDTTDEIDPETIENTEVEPETIDTPSEPSADEADTSTAAPAPAATRTPPSNLEGDLKQVLDALVQGTLALPAGSAATPHILAKEIHKLRGPDGALPSGGAVAAAMDRWAEIGYIEVTSAPKAFVDYTDAARALGLSALKKAHRDKLSAERASRKAGEAVAAPATEATPVDDGTVLDVEVVQPEETAVAVSGDEVGEHAPF